MTELRTVIATLLYEHETVIVPGLGAFIRQERGAKVNVITNEFERPSALLGFDPLQREENGLLAEYLSLHDSISEEEAQQQIARFVSESFTLLKDGGTLDFPQVGTLTLDAQQQLCFTPVADNDFNGDAFGLTDLRLQPVITGSQQDWKAQVTQQLKDQNTPMTVDSKAVHGSGGSKGSGGSHGTGGSDDSHDDDPRRRGWLWLLLVLLLLALGVGGWWLYQQRQSQPPVILPPTDTTRVKTDSVVASTDTLLASPDSLANLKDTLAANQDTLAANPDILVATQDTLPAPVETLRTPSDTSEPKPFVPKAFIVGGCFSVEENALTLLNQLKEEGFAEAYIMPRGQKYFVCYGSYATVGEAQEALVRVKAESNPKAWILTK